MFVLLLPSLITGCELKDECHRGVLREHPALCDLK